MARVGERCGRAHRGSSVNIELHIERMVLDGLQVAPRDRPNLQAAVEAELTRLLATGGLRSELLSGGAMRSLGAGEIHVTNHMSPLHLGNRIAQAVHDGVGAETGSQRPSSAPSAISRTPLG
jgi:hypothetical protein